MMCVLGPSFRPRLHSWIGKIVSFMIRLNLFATTTHDVQKVHRQRINTRVFIATLLVSLTVLSFYQWIAIQTETIIVVSPTHAQYDQLYIEHRATLRCLCSQPFVPYSAFIKITPRLHQVCSSEIISPAWYTQLALANGTGDLSYVTFWPMFGSSYFQQLASFCSLVNTTINDAYRVFSINVYTNNQVVPRSVLLPQAQEFSDLYIKSTEVETNRSFSFIRDTTFLNQFITGKETNFYVIAYADGSITLYEGSSGYLNPSRPSAGVGGCLCMSTGNNCGFYAYFTNNGNDRIFYTSLVIKCFPSESVLSSTLECWYNPTCTALARRSYALVGVPNVFNSTPLDNTIPSRFPINRTIERVMYDLLLENWTVSFSYEQYYNTCAPISCTYTIEQQFDLFLFIVTAVATYGGLSKGLRLLIPLLVSLFLLLLRYLRARRSTAVQPCSLIEAREHPGKKRASFCYPKLY
jgi:hypothetical protein